MGDARVVEVQKVAWYFRLVDFLLIPFMWMLSGFKFEYPQETHPWHIQKVDCTSLGRVLSDEQVVILKGDDPSGFSSSQRLPFFHIPFLGRWKNYFIVEAEDFKGHWHVGWVIEEEDSQRCEIQKLRIQRPDVKLLKGPIGMRITFFGINEEGVQIPIHMTQEGKLGDKKSRRVRLF